MTDPVAKMVEDHTKAMVQLTLSNVEKVVYLLKGTEVPTDKYDCGYRDALDTVLIQIRKLDFYPKED